MKARHLSSDGSHRTDSVTARGDDLDGASWSIYDTTLYVQVCRRSWRDLKLRRRWPSSTASSDPTKTHRGATMPNSTVYDDPSARSSSRIRPTRRCTRSSRPRCPQGRRSCFCGTRTARTAPGCRSKGRRLRVSEWSQRRELSRGVKGADSRWPGTAPAPASRRAGPTLPPTTPPTILIKESTNTPASGRSWPARPSFGRSRRREL